MHFPGDCESIVELYPLMSMDPLERPELPRVSFETSPELPASLVPQTLDCLHMNSPEPAPDHDSYYVQLSVITEYSVNFPI